MYLINIVLCPIKVNSNTIELLVITSILTPCKSIVNKKLKKFQEFAAGVHTYEVGVNAYADLTVEEFKQLLTGFNATKSFPQMRQLNLFTPNNEALPTEVDWRPKVK